MFLSIVIKQCTLAYSDFCLFILNTSGLKNIFTLTLDYALKKSSWRCSALIQRRLPPTCSKTVT